MCSVYFKPRRIRYYNCAPLSRTAKAQRVCPSQREIRDNRSGFSAKKLGSHKDKKLMRGNIVSRLPRLGIASYDRTEIVVQEVSASFMRALTHSAHTKMGKIGIIIANTGKQHLAVK